MLEVDFDETPVNKNTRLKDGRHTDLNNATYHKMQGISASGIKKALQEPQIYLKKHLLTQSHSPALEMGTALHEALLEPDKFHISNYDLEPAKQKTLKHMINNGKVIFDYILKNTANEHSFIYYDEVLEETRKVRPDAYDEAKGIVYDVKSTRYNDPDKFAKDAYRLGYHVQASFYLDTLKALGFRANHFAFLVVPSETPYEPFAFEVGEELLEDGRAIYSELLDTIYNMKKAGDYTVRFRRLELPTWRRKQLGLE